MMEATKEDLIDLLVRTNVLDFYIWRYNATVYKTDAV